MFSDSSNSDDSQVPEALLNTKSALRVSVCLEHYYTDVRARCYILVPRNRRVRWLERRLQNLFPLLANFHLSTNGHLLPPSEPLALLTPEDTIDVIPYQETRAELISNKDDANLSLGNNKRKGCALKTPFSNKLCVPETYHRSHRDLNKSLLHSEKNVITSNCSLKDDIDGVNISSSALAERSPVYINGDDRKSIDQISQSNDTQTLFKLKQQALALLETQVAVDTNTTEQDSSLTSRRRRRVRKRKGQMQTLSQLEYQSLPEDDTSTPTRTELVPCSEDVTETSNLASSSMEQSSDTALTPQHEVARNNAICSRKPRLVQSLDC